MANKKATLIQKIVVTNFLTNDMVSKPPINPIVFERASKNNMEANTNNIPNEVPKNRIRSYDSKK